MMDMNPVLGALMLGVGAVSLVAGFWKRKGEPLAPNFYLLVFGLVLAVWGAAITLG
jgi:hypothetical protein